MFLSKSKFWCYLHQRFAYLLAIRHEYWELIILAKQNVHGFHNSLNPCIVWYNKTPRIKNIRSYPLPCHKFRMCLHLTEARLTMHTANQPLNVSDSPCCYGNLGWVHRADHQQHRGNIRQFCPQSVRPCSIYVTGNRCECGAAYITSNLTDVW